jgi:hypothetical protein
MIDLYSSFSDFGQEYKHIYEDGSWEWKTSYGHYFWNKTTNMLSFKGYKNNNTSPIIYIESVLSGGGEDYDITSGTMIGVRTFAAWSGGSPNSGMLKIYKTVNRNDESYTDQDEIVVMENVTTSGFDWDLVIATFNTVGGIKSSSDTFKVRVDPDTGIMSVNGLGDLEAALNDISGVNI